MGTGNRSKGRAGPRTHPQHQTGGGVPRVRQGAAREVERVRHILRRLKAEYPDAQCELEYRRPFELLVATILSAQCTDAQVNRVTPVLFRRYPTAKALAQAEPGELEEVIRSTGFFRTKAKSLIGMASALVERHGSRVPADMEALQHLPGVGRKTANVVLGNAFGRNEGITVDTHVARLSKLLGLSRQTDPLKIEQDLMGLVPQRDWTMISHLLIWHGRRVCVARRPRCAECTLHDRCPSSTV